MKDVSCGSDSCGAVSASPGEVLWSESAGLAEPVVLRWLCILGSGVQVGFLNVW